jgi:2-amino-4-hydroxy-6-hydroxymethyldihydropteridine diphosphokinase
LEATPGVSVLRSSSVYETEPVGEVTEQRDFYNAVVEVDTSLDPRGLLEACKRIERELGRSTRGPRHGPRPIDLDLLLVGDRTSTTGDLVLPHRDLTHRRFVLEPLLELSPDLELPDGSSLADALAELGDAQRVTRVGSLAVQTT